jgi:Ser/Thr protein kinase RdoA (MazF antagonist)
MLKPSELLAAINAERGATYALAGRYAGGEQGAYQLRDASGRAGVLKWSAGAEAHERYRRAALVTGWLRRHGYPAPQYVAFGRLEGVSYSIQEALPGRPLASLPPALVGAAIALNDAQAGAAGDLPREWPAPVRDPLLYGGEGFCLHESLRAHGAEAARLLDALLRIAQDAPPGPWPDHDVVHYDFSHANLLAEGGALSGVIDWEGVCAGDRAFDLVTLWFYCDDAPEADALLWRHLRRTVAPLRLRLYVAHMALRQVDWSIRFHDARAVRRWLDRAGATLALATPDA